MTIIDDILGKIKDLRSDVEKLKRVPTGSGGSGDTTSPATNTDNAIARWDGADSKTLQNSLVTVDDAGSINIPAGETYDINGSPHTHVLGDHDHSGDASDGGIIVGATRWISVKDYGATGDGATDDTSAISDAIAAIPAAGGVLYFPPGTYKTSGGFTLANPTTVIGAGMGGFDGTTAISEIDCTSATVSLFTVTAYIAAFRDIALVNTAGSTPSNGAGITVAGSTLVQKVDYESISVSKFYIDIDVQVGWGWIMKNCYLHAPVLYALKIQNTENGDAGDWSIIASSFYAEVYDSDAAIRIESSGGAKITNCKINKGLDTKKFNHGIDLAVGADVETAQLMISNSSIENMRGNAINGTTNASKPSTWIDIIIIGVQVGLSNTTGHAVELVANAAGEFANLTIVGCVFDSGGIASAQSAVAITNINRGYIGGNVYLYFASLLSQTSCTNIVTGTEVPQVSDGGIQDPTTEGGDMIYRQGNYGVNLATVALGASATASATENGYVAGNAIDGDDATFWDSPSPLLGRWLKIDLGSSKAFSSFRILQHPTHDINFDAVVFKVETSTNDSTWTLQDSYGRIDGDDEFNFPAEVTARYIRFTATARSGADLYGWMISTIEIYDAPLPGLAALAIGDEGDVLTVASGLPAWEAPGGTIADHDHSGNAGDGGTFDAANLTSGAASDGDILTADGSGGAAWEAPAAGGGDVATDAIWDAKGDLAVGTGANTAARLPVGADGKFLKAASGEATGLIWDALAGGGDALSSATSSDNQITRYDGTNNKTVQASLATVDDNGGINIPTGQTYNINGSPHTHAGSGGYTEGAHVYNASTITDGTGSPVPFGAERYDTDGIHDNSTNNTRLTCKTEGKYLIWGNVRYEAGATLARQLTIKLNNTTYIASVSHMPVTDAGATTDVQISCIYALGVNDYVELIPYTSSGALDIVAGSAFSPEFAMQRIG